jgi:SynChlorMet cassette protein ScmC
MNSDTSKVLSTENSGAVSSMRLRLGPLRYLLHGHDDWGKEALSRLHTNVECVGFDGPPGRIMHLLEFRPSLQEHREMLSDCLPDRLAKFLPEHHPKRGWKLTSDQAGNVTWCHSGYSHSIWTWNTETPHHNALFQLPWHPTLDDMVKMGGGVLHAGLAIVEDRGCIFTAPPGGGKTTTLSRIPSPWQVAADDAVLVWPAGDGTFQATPMPTWGVLLSVKDRIPSIGRWKVGATFQIAGVILLNKAQHERLTPLRPIDAAQHLYRAFSEHPMVVTNRDPFRKELFRLACNLSRAAPSWELELSLGGAFWELLPGVLLHDRPFHS